MPWSTSWTPQSILIFSFSRELELTISIFSAGSYNSLLQLINNNNNSSQARMEDSKEHIHSRRWRCRHLLYAPSFPRHCRGRGLEKHSQFMGSVSGQPACKACHQGFHSWSGTEPIQNYGTKSKQSMNLLASLFTDDLLRRWILNNKKIKGLCDWPVLKPAMSEKTIEHGQSQSPRQDAELKVIDFQVLPALALTDIFDRWNLTTKRSRGSVADTIWSPFIRKHARP